MRKIAFFITLLIAVVTLFHTITSAQVQPPAGWGDFQLGLVNDNSNIINVRMKKALSENVNLHYRYAYVNNGVDPNTNALSWLFNQWGTDYSKNSIDMGLRAAYVIYMLQEEGGSSALKNNILNTTFMRNYFTSIRIVAEKSKGYKSIFVIEPDTWGYFLQDALQQGTQSDPRLIPANVNNLGAGFEHLKGLPNTLSGVAQGVIKTIRQYAPDAYCGLLMSFWSVAANGATGPPVADGAKGMVYWNQSDVDYSAKRNADFANQLLPATGDRGDFIGVEKNGWSAGNWLVKQNRNDYYWNDTQNAKWVSWSKTLSQNVSLPLLGWQISIGHIGLPNTVNRYEDTFMPYFFTHVPEFINAGFIGFLAGKGLADCTDFTNQNGNELESNGSAGDNGWFFEQVKTFDQGRPYLGGTTGPSVTFTSPSNNSSFSPDTSITLAANASAGSGCSVAKVEFFLGSVKICEDTTSPYSCSWNTPAIPGTYTITARVTNSCGSTASAIVSISVGNTAPATSITSPSGGASFTAPASITINANATDADGTITKVEFYQGTTRLGEDTSSPYSYSWTNVAAGNYSLTSKAFDNAGVSTTSAAIAITVTTGDGSCSGIPAYVSGTSYANGAKVTNVNKKFECKVSGWCSLGGAYEPGVGWAAGDAWTDLGACTGGNINPTATISSPSNGASFTAPASITINATASDSDGTVSKVEFFNGTTLLGTDTSSPYSFSWTNVAAGSYALTAKATDNAGGTGTSSIVNVTVNGNSSPTASITSPANNASFTPPATITINATASDVGGSVSKVEFFNGATKLGEDLTSPYSYTWSGVAAGTYNLTAKATDNTGLTGTSSAVTVVVASNTPPTASITSPSNNATFTAPASITISATASDAGGSVTKVEFFNGSTKLGEDTSSPYSYSWTGVAEGSYALTAKATDNSGLTGTSSVINVTVSGGGCSYPQYSENGGYVAGNRVKNGTNSYECKPYPYSGWCNGSAWAYAPGTGSYWQDAWILVGPCGSARSRTDETSEENTFSEQDVVTDADGLAMYPNPSKRDAEQTVTFTFEKTPKHVNVQLQDINGMHVFTYTSNRNRKKTVSVQLENIPSGFYMMRISTESRSWVRKYIIKE